MELSPWIAAMDAFVEGIGDLEVMNSTCSIKLDTVVPRREPQNESETSHTQDFPRIGTGRPLNVPNAFPNAGWGIPASSRTVGAMSITLEKAGMMVPFCFECANLG
jgi:hypothetical protein